MACSAIDETPYDTPLVGGIGKAQSLRLINGSEKVFTPKAREDRTCHICHRDFRYPSNLRQHFLRKKPCSLGETLLRNKPIEKIIGPSEPIEKIIAPSEPIEKIIAPSEPIEKIMSQRLYAPIRLSMA